jgi:hypothetical protein
MFIQKGKFGCRLLLFWGSFMMVFQLNKANEVKILLRDGEWARIWNTAIVVYFKVPYPSICLETGEDYEKPRPGHWVPYWKWRWKTKYFLNTREGLYSCAKADW